jgi:fructosamine-3-kinase
MVDDLRTRLAELFGDPPTAVRPLAGGSFGRPYAVTLADGRTVFVKVAGGAPDGLLASEARSLRRLAAAGGAPELGYLASEVLPGGTEAPDWPTFYGTARLLPFLARAEAAGGIGGRDAADVRRVVDRLPALAGPDEPPALLHGDLWSGNELWTDGPAGAGATVIDPACHGGHRETDLALLALFGLPHLETVLAAYDAEFPLGAGWRDRVALHQVFPLLVHAVLFGGPYGAATGDAARRALGASGAAAATGGRRPRG